MGVSQNWDPLSSNNSHSSSKDVTRDPHLPETAMFANILTIALTCAVFAVILVSSSDPSVVAMVVSVYLLWYCNCRW